MLYVTLGSDINALNYVSAYFDNHYEVDWLNNDFAKAVIKGIDNSEHVQDHLIVSPVLGGIAPTALSTGCKAVLILYNVPDVVVCGERMGDNCFEWVFKLAKERDLHITLSHILRLDYEFEMTITNTGHVVHNRSDIINEIMYCNERSLIKHVGY